jgi:hypothetical protein
LQASVQKVSEIVEANLLAEVHATACVSAHPVNFVLPLLQFDEIFDDLLLDIRNMELVEQCKNLAEWLHTFGGGQQLQKRFIFNVVNKTMPIVNTGKSSSSSSGNAVDDHLSALFGTISNMCRDHFLLIRQIFPAQFVARVTRLLIQRMFHDPAFGIQTRVELILSSKQQSGRNAQFQLNSQDYLDALCNVREKLTGLFTILMEHCVHPALLGLGAESAAEIYHLKDGAGHGPHHGAQRRGSNASGAGIDGNRDRLASHGSIGDENSFRTGDEQSTYSGLGAGTVANDEGRQLEMQKSETEVRRFLEDQVSMLCTY